MSGKSNISGMEHELLNGLQKLLQQFNSQTFGGDNGKGKGYGEGSPPNVGRETPKLSTDVGLLQALKRLVTRAEKRPEGLLHRLQSLVVAAGKASGKGQTFNPKQKPGKSQQLGGKGVSKDEKGAGKQNQSKGGAKGKKSAEVISKESDWTLVGRKGKPQPPLSFSNDKSEFRLRESDWPGYTLVPRVEKLGAILDSDKKSDPLVILVFASQELVNLLQMIQGEKGIRITVLCPCKKGDTITVDGFPNIHFEEKRYPVQDNAGKVLAKIMACWTNGVAFNQRMRIVVPQDRRPTFKPESRNEHTTFFRLRADSRYCQEKHWASVKTDRERLPGSGLRGFPPMRLWEFLTLGVGNLNQG